jgi:hypothetical protein
MAPEVRRDRWTVYLYRDDKRPEEVETVRIVQALAPL